MQQFLTEFGITITTGDVWLSIGEAILFGAAAWILGVLVARWVGLLARDAPAGETLGVGLACGLIVFASWWAAIWSAGQSSFVPVAIGFVVAIVLGLARRARRTSARIDEPEASSRRPLVRRSLILTALAGALFVVGVALLYGSTIAPSPRDGVQPVEFVDQAYYSVLARDLSTTGIETSVSTSGFELSDLPRQAWYHWAELWLASAAITIFGAAPVAARHFVVLPLVLLAAASLTGTVVRRLARTNSRRAYIFGFLACLFLAPMPIIPGPFFSSWAEGMIFGIGFYGLAAVAVLLGLYCLAVLGERRPTWALASFVGSAAAFVLPAHIVIALLGAVGVGIVWTIRTLDGQLATGRLPRVAPVWVRTIIAAFVVLLATIAWGLQTGHGLGGSGSSGTIDRFNASWAASVAITFLGGGVFLAIVVMWSHVRKRASLEADIYLGTLTLVLLGAIAWGARLGDFNMFHVFFAGIAVFATPVAAVAAWKLIEYLRKTRRVRLATALATLCVIQIELGIVSGTLRLQWYGPREDDEPIPLALLQTIKELPTDSKLAYTCPPFDEVAFTVPRLLSIDAHTGNRVVPMCFEADFFSTLIGGEPSLQYPNASFAWAPQRVLYPDAATTPPSAAVASFLKLHGIDYIYADAQHPNFLVTGVIPLARSGDAEILRVP